MMRPLVFLLVFANLLVFSLTSGLFGAPTTQVDDGRAHASLSPDRIQIVSKAGPPSLPLVNACLLWQNLPAEAAAKLVAIAAADASLKLLEEAQTQKKNSFWLMIPPALMGKVGAEKKSDELKQIGLKSFFIVSEPGVDQWAISLGLYATEDEANTALEALRRQGVRSAKSIKREHVQQKSIWRLRGTLEKLEPLRGLFPESAPRACPESSSVKP